MKTYLCVFSCLLGSVFAVSAQEVKFEEYDLDNGMHVILHQDNTAPVVLYHKSYDPNPLPVHIYGA